MPLDPFLQQSQDSGGPQMPQLKAGQRLFNGRYELKQALGAGGMGVVWLARDRTEETEVALKFLPSVLVLQEGEMKRLREEVRAGKELRHPRLVATYGMEVENGIAAIVMEYVPGQTLKQKLEVQERGFFEPEEIAAWVKDMTDGLGYLHEEAKRIHRDLKPANVMIDAADRAKLMDFGISHRIKEGVSKHSKTNDGAVGSSSSTLAYASPQQITGKPSHKTDDLYSLGATIYELLTGTPPFFRGGMDAVRGQIKDEPPTPVMERRQELVEEGLNADTGKAVPDVVEQVVLACLNKERAGRPDAQKIAQSFHPSLQQYTDRVESSKPAGGVVLVAVPAGNQAPSLGVEIPYAERARSPDPASGFIPGAAPAVRRASSPDVKPRNAEQGGPSGQTSASTPAAAPALPQASSPGRKPPSRPFWSKPLPAFAAVFGLGIWVLISQPAKNPRASQSADSPTVGSAAAQSDAHVRSSVGIKVMPEASMRGSGGSVKTFVNSLGMTFVPLLSYKDGRNVFFSIWETRSKDYAAFMKSGAYVMTGNNGSEDWRNDDSFGMPVGRGALETAQESSHPVAHVSHDDATAFCAWLTQKDRAAGLISPQDEYRLPTDVEWSYAAGIGDQEDVSASPKDKSGKLPGVYPWGSGFPPQMGSGNYADTAAAAKANRASIANYTDGYPTTAPAGSFKPNAFGLYDMGGNLWEWTDSALEPGSERRTLRGGSWGDNEPEALLSSFRYHRTPGVREREIGFRCVLVVGGG